eukprot:Anaeramoba_ignava/a609586_18.p1 GENE.a609586_18~~a609586_18.p1  ORF type:complete len:153 (+),score=20.66 a609586_18:19-477(+)
MISRTKSTITLPLYSLKSRAFNPEKDKKYNLKDGSKTPRISYHSVADEKVTILTSHIIEVRKVKRPIEKHKNRDGSYTITKQEIIVKVQTVNNTYMVFAEPFEDDAQHVDKKAEDVVNEIAAAIDDTVANSNPFVNITNQLEHRFNKLTDTI